MSAGPSDLSGGGRPPPPRAAVILAAGRGTRLGARGREIPKGFLCVGGRPIVEESLARLERAGVERVVIVTGHLRERYDELAARWTGRAAIETVHNPDYADSGSLWSLRCARELVGEDVFLLESDLVYERRALDVLARAEHADVVLLSGPTGSRDEVWVRADDGFLARMSKDARHLGGPATGELVGISRISRDLFEALAREADAHASHTLHLEYEQHGLVALAARRPIRCALVPDLVWCEVDDEAQLARAQELVHPRVVARDDAGDEMASVAERAP